MNNGEPTQEQWRVLAEQASREKDPETLIELAEEIVEQYDEAKKKKP